MKLVAAFLAGLVLGVLVTLGTGGAGKPAPSKRAVLCGHVIFIVNANQSINCGVTVAP